MGEVINRVVKVWLDSAIPPALKDVAKYQSVIKSAEQFCSVLETQGYTRYELLRNWVDNAPTMWLNKCRETALDSVRSKLSSGIGEATMVERVEKQMVSLAEGKELAKSGTVKSSAQEQDWDSAWGFDEEVADESAEVDEPMVEEDEAPAAQQSAEDDGADAWGWDDGPEEEPTDPPAAEEEKSSPKSEEDEAADAWGWGDDDVAEGQGPTPAPVSTHEPEPEPKKQKLATPASRGKGIRTRDQDETREMVLKETYHISSMPEPVLTLISAILEDGAALTGPGYATTYLQSC